MGTGLELIVVRDDFGRVAITKFEYRNSRWSFGLASVNFSILAQQLENPTSVVCMFLLTNYICRSLLALWIIVTKLGWWFYRLRESCRHELARTVI